MKLYSVTGAGLKSVDTQPFKLEKEIQTLVENNLEELFGLEFVKSELTIKNFRFDTLAYDRENRAFVIIEYKKDRNFSVIDQGFAYMSVLFDNKADFILEYYENSGVNLNRNEIDWSQSRVLFIAPQFTEYQKTSVNFRDVPFELWEIKRYNNGLISLNQHKTTSQESIVNTTKSKDDVVVKVSREVEVSSEEHLLSKSKSRPEWVKEMYYTLREKMLNLEEVEVVPKKSYISFQGKEPILAVAIHDGGLYCILNMKKGTLDDPYNFSKQYDDEQKHWGNGDYYLSIYQNTDIDYVMTLINQCYKHQNA